MKRMLPSLTLILLITSACDAPRRMRNPYPSADVAISNVNDNNNNADNNNNNQDDQADDQSTNDPGSGSSTEPGFENCNLNYTHHNQFIGDFAICQSSLDDTRFKIKISQSDPTEGTCFVPVRRNTNGTSFKLGIAECVNNEAARVYTATLTKELFNYKINGVMVLKARALSPYLQCMNAISDFNTFLGSGGLSAIDRSCFQGSYQTPQSYAQCVCNKFVGNYRPYYSDDVSFSQNN